MMRLPALGEVWYARRSMRLSRRCPPLLLLTLVVTAVAIAGAGCATSASSSRTTAAGLPRPSRETLPNGVVLITQEHRASDVVAVQLWLRVGARDEQPDELGLSHYLEHMLFKGTATRPPGSIDRLIEGLGGLSNAFTAYDYTHFDVVVPAEHLGAAVDLLADIAVNASFPPEEIDRERQVVFEEIRLLEDDPERFLERRLGETAYDGHPYGRPILGTRPLIEQLTRERLTAYYRKHYIPANMAVVVVGAVASGEVRRLVGAAFGRLPATPASPVAVPIAPVVPERRTADVARPERQAYMGLGWKAPPISGEDVFAVDLLTYILGDSPSSRFNVVVRERERLVYHIQSGYSVREKGGLVSVDARLEPENLERAEQAIVDVIRRVKADGVTDAERQRALVTAESLYAFDIETAEGLAKAYGQAETTWTLDNELAYLARLGQVGVADIQTVARRYFDETGYTRVRLVPGRAAQ
jgi:zinc protease